MAMNQPFNWNSVCRNAAQDVVRVLERLGSVENGNFPSTTWTVVERNCGSQRNSDDCGVFVAVCAASVVLQTPPPTSVDGFRAIMASQVVDWVKGTRLDWDVVKFRLSELGGGGGNGTVGVQWDEEVGESQVNDVVGGMGDEEVGEEFTERHLLCEWPAVRRRR